MNRTIYNLDQLIRVRLIEKELEPNIIWIDEVKGWFGRVKLVAGFYEHEGFYHPKKKLRSIEWIKDNYYIIDGKVVYKLPYILMTFRNGLTNKKTFNTIQKAHQELLVIKVNMENDIEIEMNITKEL